MKLKLSNYLFFLTFIYIFSLAQIPSGYYDNANGKSGASLKTALFNIIKNPSVTSYGGLYTAYQTTDKKANGKVWDMYSDVPSGTPAYEYSFGSGTCGNYSKEGDCYNREHSFPQSWFNSASPMVSDLFHVYPTDGKVNGVRGNYPYGRVGTATWTSTNGSKLGVSNYPGFTGTVFEPIDAYKGDFARTYFYMVTCYENLLSGWSSPIITNNTYPAIVTWELNLFWEWHNADPVSQKEIDRNNAAYAIQHNRNPFIDHPEYVALVWGFSTTTPGLIVSAPNNVVLITTTTGPVNGITLSGTNLQGNVNIRSSGNGTSINFSNTTNSGFVNPYHVIPSNGSISGLVLYIQPTTTLSSDIQIVTITVSGGGVLDKIFQISITGDALSAIPPPTGTSIAGATFSSVCTTNGWNVYNQNSNKGWLCGTQGMNANAYAGTTGTSGSSWLISPSFDLSSYQSVDVSFTSWTKFSDAGLFYPQLTVYYSTNYTTGDPLLASWTSISGFSFSPSNSQSTTPSGYVRITNLTQSGVKFAFVYRSSGTSNTNATSWTVDRFFLSGLPFPPPNTVPSFNLDLVSDPVVLDVITNSGLAFNANGNNLTGSIFLNGGNLVLLSSNSISGFSSALSILPISGLVSNVKIFVKPTTTLPSGVNFFTISVSGGGIVNTTEDVSISVAGQSLSNDNFITSFTIPFQISNTTISGNNITLIMPYGTNLSSLNPSITVSNNSVITPISGVLQNFSGVVQYTVTSQSLVSNVYNVNVQLAPSDENSITGFNISGQVGATTIIGKNIFINMPFGTDIGLISPIITISPLATVSPFSGQIQSFNTIKNYTVTSQSLSKNVYTVIVQILPNTTTGISNSNGLNIIYFPKIILNNQGIAKAFSVSATSVTGNLLLISDNNFLLSTDSTGTYNAALFLPLNGSNISNTTVFIKAITSVNGFVIHTISGIIGQNKSIITLSISGNFMPTISGLNPLAIDNGFESNWIIYPNPTSRYLYIKSNINDFEYSYRISTIKGELVVEKSNQIVKILEIDLKGYTKGNYILDIFNNNQILIQKMFSIE
ncbi:MAG: endonuclease [Bacteroidota bacterium]|nr:endonuclease [Bacteroidota bacterium]